MFIMVDKNEEVNSPQVIQNLQRVFPNLEVTTLDCADIKIILDNGDVLAIERKRVGDFLSSIGDGRLFNQVERMHATSKWCCVIIEGMFSFDSDDMAVIPIYNKQGILVSAETTGWRGASVRGAMYAVQWSGCPIIITDPKNFPYIVMDLIRFCSKPTEHTQQLGRRRVVSFPPPTLSEEVIAAFPGVGMKRSKALNEFASRQNDNGVGTLAESLTWASVLHKIKASLRPEGWGDVTVKNFRIALGLQPWEELGVIENKQDKEAIQKENKARERGELATPVTSKSTQKKGIRSNGKR